MKTPEQLLDAICGQGNWSQHNLATLRVRDAEAREAAIREAAEVTRTFAEDHKTIQPSFTGITTAILALI